jgi:hypothetical protein
MATTEPEKGGNGASERRDAEPGVPDPFAAAAQELAARIARYEDERNSDEFEAERRHLRRVTQGFVLAVRSSAVAFTRYPDGKHWLLKSSMDDFLESSIAIVSLGEQGVFNIGRRELRFMLESVVKCVFVDQQLPGGAPLGERIALASDPARVPRSSVDVVDQIACRMVPADELRAAVRSAFGALSGYTHVSKRQLEERYRRVTRGEFIGFESAATLRAFVRLLVQTYDLVLALVFEGIGPSFTRDLFVQALAEERQWAFRKTPFVAQVAKSVEY